MNKNLIDTVQMHVDLEMTLFNSKWSGLALYVFSQRYWLPGCRCWNWKWYSVANGNHLLSRNWEALPRRIRLLHPSHSHPPYNFHIIQSSICARNWSRTDLWSVQKREHSASMPMRHHDGGPIYVIGRGGRNARSRFGKCPMSMSIYYSNVFDVNDKVILFNATLYN